MAPKAATNRAPSDIPAITTLFPGMTASVLARLPDFVSPSELQCGGSKEISESDCGNISEDRSFCGAANRSYYAIFHSIRSLLALEKVDFSKHAGVMAYFQKNYVKSGIFEKEYSKILTEALYNYDNFGLESQLEFVPIGTRFMQK